MALSVLGFFVKIIFFWRIVRLTVTGVSNTDVYVGRNLWICEIHGLRNLWILSSRRNPRMFAQSMDRAGYYLPILYRPYINLTFINYNIARQVAVCDW